MHRLCRTWCDLCFYIFTFKFTTVGCVTCVLIVSSAISLCTADLRARACVYNMYVLCVGVGMVGGGEKDLFLHKILCAVDSFIPSTGRTLPLLSVWSKRQNARQRWWRDKSRKLWRITNLLFPAILQPAKRLLTGSLPWLKEMSNNYCRKSLSISLITAK